MQTVVLCLRHVDTVAIGACLVPFVVYAVEAGSKTSLSVEIEAEKNKFPVGNYGLEKG